MTGKFNTNNYSRVSGAVLASTSVTASSSVSMPSSVTSSATLPLLPPGEEIYDLMRPVLMAYPWLKLFLEITVYVLIGYVVYRLGLWLLTEPIKVRYEIKQSPEKQALRALERLKLSPVWQKQQIKEICESLVYILKSYLKDEYDIGLGSAATSDEMLQSLQLKHAEPALLKQVANLFELCDRIKFTGYGSEDADTDKMLELVKSLIFAEGWTK